jgi:hypothetical protein
MFQIIHDSSGNFISLTSSHLVYVIDKGYVNAARIKIKDKLRIYSKETDNLIDFTVEKISFDLKKGFIAPLTFQGNILVNNIHASCYAEINSHSTADWAMMPVKLWYKISKYFRDQSEESNIVEISQFSYFMYNLVSNYLPSLLIFQ